MNPFFFFVFISVPDSYKDCGFLKMKKESNALLSKYFVVMF